MTDPSLSAEKRTIFMRALMNARRGVRDAMHIKDGEREKAARKRVHKAKLKLGERGEPWWSDGAPDYNQHLAKNTPYKKWFDAQ